MLERENGGYIWIMRSGCVLRCFVYVLLRQVSGIHLVDDLARKHCEEKRRLPWPKADETRGASLPDMVNSIRVLQISDKAGSHVVGDIACLVGGYSLDPVS